MRRSNAVPVLNQKEKVVKNTNDVTLLFLFLFHKLLQRKVM